MDYHSAVDINVGIREALVEAFLAEIASLQQRRDHPAWLLFDRLRLEGRFLVCDEYFAPWGDDRAFALFLARYAEQGYVRSVGEDGRRWGYYFDGAGDVYPLTYLESIGETPLTATQIG